MVANYRCRLRLRRDASGGSGRYESPHDPVKQNSGVFVDSLRDNCPMPHQKDPVLALGQLKFRFGFLCPAMERNSAPAGLPACPLFTDALLKWEPGKVKMVAMDARPVERPYVRRGVVARLHA
jgi:hypothetical protein